MLTLAAVPVGRADDASSARPMGPAASVSTPPSLAGPASDPVMSVSRPVLANWASPIIRLAGLYRRQ